MNKINYDKEMEKIVSSISSLKIKPKLLIHACCAPCSSGCLDRVSGVFDTTVFFYNPNIDTEKEYSYRAEEEIKLCKILGIKYVIEDYDKNDFISKISGHEKDSEGGARCSICFNLRLSKTAEYAFNNGFDYFTTTLTLSPLKNAELINEIGEKIGKEKGVKFLNSDFKKRGGYLLSIEKSKEYNLYRQNYCGCEFSKKDNKI